MLPALRQNHQGQAAIEEFVRVKDDRRGVGLLAKDDEGVGGEPFWMMVSASCLELSMGEKRAKAMCAAMRKTAMVRAMLTVAAMCFF